MEPQIVRSISEAEEAAEARLSRNLPTFPAGILAEGHSPDKESLRVSNVEELIGSVEAALYVSRDEFGRNGAEIYWCQPL